MGCRTGGNQNCRDSRLEGSRKRDSGKEEVRKGGMIRKDAGKDEYRKGWIQDKR